MCIKRGISPPYGNFHKKGNSKVKKFLFATLFYICNSFGGCNLLITATRDSTAQILDTNTFEITRVI